MFFRGIFPQGAQTRRYFHQWSQKSCDTAQDGLLTQPLEKTSKKKKKVIKAIKIQSSFRFPFFNSWQPNRHSWLGELLFCKGIRKAERKPKLCVCRHAPRGARGLGRGTQIAACNQHMYVHTATACPIRLAGTSPNSGGVWKCWGRGSNYKISPCQKVWECYIKGQLRYYPFH